MPAYLDGPLRAGGFTDSVGTTFFGGAACVCGRRQCESWKATSLCRPQRRDIGPRTVEFTGVRSALMTPLHTPVPSTVETQGTRVSGAQEDSAQHSGCHNARLSVAPTA